MRVGIKSCQKNYLCIHGARAPALEFISKSAVLFDVASYDGVNTCGGDKWETITAMTATPNDAIKSQSGVGYLSTYATTRNTVTITVDHRISVGIKSDDNLFNKAVYTVTDSIGGTSLFEGTGYDSLNNDNEGVIKLVNGKAVSFDKGNRGHKTRQITVTATRALAADTSLKIKTRKACLINVKVRNSNDRPWLTEGQVRNIEEQSPVDFLISTPVEAHDYDDGQSFEFELDSAKFGGRGTFDETNLQDVTDENKLPFSIGKCSGILKVKNDILRYDNDVVNGITKSRLYTLAIKVTDQDSDYQDFDKLACNTQTHGVAPSAPDAVKGIYCQKLNYGTIEVEIMNKNDPPYFSSTDKINNAGFTVSENAQLDDLVGKIAVSDPDADEAGKHTFKVIKLDSHDGFKIDPETGEIRVKRTLDFEDKKKYRLKVRATDTGGWKKIPLSVDSWIDITVEDANDAPTIAATLDASADENAVNAVVVSELKVIEKDVKPEWNTIQFKFTAGSSDDFNLVQSGGKWQLQTKRGFDYETEKEIKVKVFAHDNDESSKSSDMTITVKVNDVNEAPSVSGYTVHVEENVPKRAACKSGDTSKCAPSNVALTFDMVDGGQSHTYSFVSTTSLFTIDANSGEIKTIDSLDFETTAQYTLDVKIEDDDKDTPLNAEFQVIVQVKDVDEAPYIMDDDAGNDVEFVCTAVSEDAEQNHEICVIKTKDPDTSSQFRLGIETTILSGNEDDLFALSLDGSLKVKKANYKLDFEKKKKHELTIRTATCTKGSGAKEVCPCASCGSEAGYSMLKTDKKIDVTLIDSNEAPEIKMDTNSEGKSTGEIKREVNEISTEGTNVGKVIDCEDEDKSDQSSDGGCTATCIVVDHLDENKVQLPSTHVCHQANPADTGCFKMNGYQLEVADGVTLPNVGLAAQKLLVRVQCYDRAGTIDAVSTWTNTDSTFSSALLDTVDMKVSIEPINEKPNIANKKCYLFENPKAKTKICTPFGTKNIDEEVDEGIQKLKYSISKGNNKGYFSINKDDGQLSVKKKDDLDYEKQKDNDGVARFTITVTVEDDDPKNVQKDTAEVDIYILNVNEKPNKVTKWECKDVSEDSNVGDKVCDRVLYNTDGSRKDTDPEGETNQVLSFRSGNDDGIFEISNEASTYSQITIASSAKLDYENKKEHTLQVRLEEPRWSIKSEDYRGAMWYAKNGAACQNWDKQSPRTHNFSPTDASLNDQGPVYNTSGLLETTLDYITDEIVCKDMNGKWSNSECIVEGLTQGVCRDPNGEKGQIWCYTTTGDKEWDFCDENLEAEIEVTVKIMDTNEAPTLKVPKTEIKVYEDDNNGKEIGKNFRGEDKDDGDSVTYSITDDANGRFSIISSTGQIKVKDASKIDYEVDTYHTIKVKVTDNGCGCKNCANCKVKIDSDCVDTDWCDEKTGITDQTTCEAQSGTWDENAGSDASDQCTMKSGKTKGEACHDGTGDVKYKCKKQDTPTISTEIKANITVLDVNEAPSITTLTVSDIAETLKQKNAKDETNVIATLNIDEPDSGDTHTCKIISGNSNDAFGLHATEFTLYVRNESAIDFEAGTTEYKVEVECTDAGGLSATMMSTLTIVDINEPPSITDESMTIKENAAAELYLSDGDEVTVTDVDNGGDVTDHVVKIIDGDTSGLFAMDGTALKVQAREWLYKVDEDSDEYANPMVFSKTGTTGELSVTCPSDQKISFGFTHQYSAGEGLNYASTLVLKGARHVNEAIDQIDMKLVSSSLSTLSIGHYDDKSYGFVNANFETGSKKTTSFSPESWVGEGNVYTVASGDFDWNNGMVTSSGSKYYVALEGSSRDGKVAASIQQTLKKLPTGEKVTLEFGVARKSTDSSISNGVEVHVSGVGRVFPSSGGITNPTFSDGYWYIGKTSKYKYLTPKGWTSYGNVVIASSCNSAWGGLCTKSGASHYLTIQKSKSKISQKVEHLPVGIDLKLDFFAACRPYYGTSAKMALFINRVKMETYGCSDIGSSTEFTKKSIIFQASSDGIAELEWLNDSPEGDQTIFLDSPSIVLPSAGLVFSSGAGRSCSERCSDLGLTCLAGHSDNAAAGDDQSDIHCRGVSTESALNIKWGDSSKYFADKCDDKQANKQGCCRCGSAAPATAPFNIDSDNFFERHSVSFIAPSAAAEVKIMNTAPNDGNARTVLIDHPQAYWSGTPGPVAQANIEFGAKSNQKTSITKLIVSPVSGKDECGPVMLERCGSWDSTNNECHRYHTVASFAQGAEYTLNSNVATDSRRWRISPLTTLPVEFSGSRCSDGTNAGVGVTSARECQEKCDAEATCKYFSWNPEGETGTMNANDRCVWSTEAQCDTKAAGAYVTYKKASSDVRSIDFPQRGTNKFVRIETPSSFAGKKDFTASFWLKLTDKNAVHRIMSKQRATGTGWNFAVSKQELSFGGMGSPTKFWKSGFTKLEVGTWYHVAGSLGNGKANLYINGVLQASKTVPLSQEASTDGNQPIVIGREWDETSVGWTSSNKNLAGGRKLTGARVAEIAVWDKILTTDEITQLAESSAGVEDIEPTKIVVYVRGIGSDGELAVGTNGVDAANVKALSKISSSSTVTKMDAVEDSPAIFSVSAKASTIKQCGMSVSILSSSSTAGAACLAANNKVCKPGEQSCEQQLCDTPGTDMSRIWAMCQPAASNSDLQIHPNDAIDASVSGGVGQTVSCPAGKVIAFGWSIQTTNDAGDKADCVRANTKMCSKGASSCSQDSCNTPGNDLQTIYLFCQPKASLHGSPVVSSTGGKSINCPAGTTGQICNDVKTEQTLQCPNNAQVVFGFGIHTTTTLDAQSASSIQRNLETTCQYSKRSCTFPFARDTVGDDVTFMFALCAGALDFETQPTFDLTLEVTDPGGLTARSTVSVEVDNRNEQPRIYDSIHEVHENSNIGTLVGKPVDAVDADEEDALRFYITGGDGSSIFNIGSCDGQISVKKNELDYELKKTYTLKVMVQDDGKNPDKLTDTATITIDLIDVNEPPHVMDMTCAVAEAKDFARREAVAIRLIGGANAMVGRLEYRVNGKWGSVCSWSSLSAAEQQKNARAACRQLGFKENDANDGTYLGVTGSASASQNNPTIATLNCADGTELSLRECSGFDATIACTKMRVLCLHVQVHGQI